MGAAKGVVLHTFDTTIGNRLKDIAAVTSRFEAFATEHDLPSRLRRSMNLVFDDLLNNVISYAYRDEEDHDITVRVELLPDRLALTLTDDGVPFDPFVYNEPDTALSLEEREAGGLGLHLVQNLMDEVQYTRRTDHNVVTLVKYLEVDQKG